MDYSLKLRILLKHKRTLTNSTHVKLMEEQLEKITSLSMKDRNALSSLDRAKIDLVSVYSINSLAWLYHIVNGSNPKESQIMGELTRIQANMKKVKGLQLFKINFIF